MPGTMHARCTRTYVQRREAALAGGHQQDQGPTNDHDPSEASSDDNDADEDQPSSPSQPHKTARYANLAEFDKTKHSMIRRYKDLSLMSLLYLQT